MLKTPATYEEQIKKLREHKCIVADEAFCTDVLMRISYYRLCAYLLPYRTKDGNRYSATRFENIYALYEFDRKMRNLLFAAIEETEVFLRASFSYFHAHKYGAIGYEAPSNFNNRHDHEKFIRKLNAEIRNNQNVLFVKHHQECYDGRFPLWVAMELFTFGMLSYFYADLHMHDQKALATELFDSIPKKVISWLRCCTDLRNICAHYGRLYFRVFSAIPAKLPNVDASSERRLFGAIMALRELYPDRGKWNNELIPRMNALFYEYSEIISLPHIGFPADWEMKIRK